MSRTLALRTEVFAGLDQAAPEVLLPNPVDGNTGRQRIILTYQPLSETQPVRRRIGRQTTQRGGHIAVDLFVLVCESSADANKIGGSRDTGLVAHDQRGGNAKTVRLLLQFLEPLACRFELRR